MGSDLRGLSLRAWLAAAAELVTEGVPRSALLDATGAALLARAGTPPPEGLLRPAAAALRPWAEAAPPSGEIAAHLVVSSLQEALTSPAEQRRRRAHYTDPALAGRLVAWAVQGWDAWPPSAPLRTWDPAVGAGSLLVAVAEAQADAGRSPGEVLGSLHGTDLDDLAVATARLALVLWAAARAPGVASPLPAIEVGDGLAADAAPSPCELVVANPPFVSPLRAGGAPRSPEVGRALQRHGLTAEGYADLAAVFLLASLDAVGPGGRVVLIAPDSLLGARGARRIRDRVGEVADLVGLWAADEPAFAASVDVVALVLERGHRASRTAVATGRAVAPVASRPVPAPERWTDALADARGVPEVDLGSGPTVGDLAVVRAGFRQHFYGVAAHLAEAADGQGPEWRPVLTAGTVDPLASAWGARPVRIAGVRWRAPVVDTEALARTDPEVGEWVRARGVPKLLVAPQTRVVEVVVDAEGTLVPGVPLISVEPLADVELDPDPVLGLWLLAAALSSPPVTAWALRRAAGTARHRDAVKLAAPQIRALPLPGERGPWREAACALRDGARLASQAVTLTRAWGIEGDDPVVGWWRDRLVRG